MEQNINWNDCYNNVCFVFKYQQDGQDVTIRADVIYEDDKIAFIALSNQPVEVEGIPKEYKRLDVALSSDMLSGCKDYDDIGVVIAKLVVNNDGDIFMSIYDIWDASNVVCEDVILDKQLNFVNDEDFSFTLSLYANCGRSPENFTIYEFDDDEIASTVGEYFDEDDVNSLFDILSEMDDEILEVFNLWGDGDAESVTYEIANEAGDIVEDGIFEIREDNVFKYRPSNKYFNETHHPKYVVLHRDSMKRSWATFNVPASFKMKNCHFPNGNPFDWEIIECDWFGDTVTDLTGPICCHGKIITASDFGDNGSYGSNDYKFFKYNEENACYEEIASIE